MLKFIDNVLGTSLSKNTNGANVIPEMKVRQIREYLDKWPMAFEPAEMNNLIDWNVDQQGNLYGPIYLGGVSSLQNRKEMKKVGAVLSIIDDRFPQHVLREYVGKRKSHLYLPLDDYAEEDISQYFEKAHDFIKYHQDRGIPLLIHCVLGKSRSSTILANYLMKKYNLTAFQALHMIKRRRSIIRPNDGFIKHLVYAENKK